MESLPLYILRGRPAFPYSQSSSVWVGLCTATYKPISHLWLIGEVGCLPLYSERSLPFGPTDMLSSVWAGPRRATSRPSSHIWLMGEVGFLPLYILRGRSPLPQQTRHPLCGEALAQRPTGPILTHGSWGKWGLSGPAQPMQHRCGGRSVGRRPDHCQRM